jgi:polyhydroxybutyrate depolymerase
MPSSAPRRRTTRAALLFGAFALLTGVAACGQSDPSAAVGTTVRPTFTLTPQNVPDAGHEPGGHEPGRGGAKSATQGAGACQSPLLTAGLTSRYVESGGQRRTVLVYFPHGHHAGKPIPLVVDLHGSGDTPLEQLQYTGITLTAEKHDFAIVAPQGGLPLTLGKSHGYAWNVPGVPLANGQPVARNAPDDVRFVRDTIDAVSKLVCADSQRIYVTGFSGGARMASQVGCVLADRVAAIAPVSGLRFPGGCHPVRPVPVISFHGTADTMNPYNGDKTSRWGSGVQAAAQRWAAENRCGKTSAQAPVVPLVTTTAYRSCTAPVELYTITGGRHAWPGTPDSMVRGSTNPKLNADELIWSFFEAHPLGVAT